MMGIYYAAPLLGPSIGPLFGGVLSQLWSWRATFYFLAIIGGVVILSFLLFKDTWRRERSLTYQSAKRRAIYRAEEREKIRAARLGKDNSTEKGNLDGNIVQVDSNTAKVTLVDMNPFKPIWSILKRKNNLAILFPSGISSQTVPSIVTNKSFVFTASTLFVSQPYYLQYNIAYVIRWHAHLRNHPIVIIL